MDTSRTNTRLRRIVLTLLALASASCVGDDGTLSIGGDPSDPRYDRLRAALNVTVISDAPGVPDDGVEPAEFAEIVRDVCFRRFGQENPSCSLGCRNISCAVDAYICTSHRLLEIVQHAAATEQQTTGSLHADWGVLLVPPQDQPTNAALAEQAYYYASLALNAAGATLGSLCPAGSLDDTAYGSWADTAPPGVPTTAEYVAAAYTEAVDLAIEASDEHTRASLAVADATYSNDPELDSATHLALLAPFASRSAAAHLLVGGAAGLPGMDVVSAEGFFPIGTLSPTERQALTYLRASGLPPAVVNDPAIDIDELLVTGWPVVDPMDAYSGSDSVARRLSSYLADPLLDPTTTTLGIEAFESRIGIRRDAFVAARNWLGREIVVFDRALDVQGPPERVAGGTTPFPIFTATHTLPSLPPRTYFPAIARFVPVPAPGFNLPPPGYAGIPTVAGYAPLDSLVDGALVGARLLIASANPRLSGEALEPAREALAGFVGAPPKRIEGRLYTCLASQPAEAGGAMVTLHVVLGVERADQLRIVAGREGLECAVGGTIDGADCDLAEYTVDLFDPWSSFSVLPEYGYETGWLGYGVGVENFVSLSPRANSVLLFMVRPVDDDLASPGAGQYEEVVGVELARTTMSGTPSDLYCVTTIISADIERDAGDLITPDPANPSSSRESCAGVPTDQLIPLENELTSDGDAVESSWRHYLSIASRAADEADALGEDLIRTGLELDLRAETAIDDLERLCGVSLNITSVAGADIMARIGSPPPCGPGYVESSGTCVLDPIELAIDYAATDEDAARLAACLGSSTTIPWATFGDQPVCIWQTNPDDAATACTGRDAVHPCPFDAEGEDDAMTPFIDERCDHVTSTDLPMGVTTADLRAISQTLNLFHAPEPDDPDSPPGGATSGRTYPCEALARYRAQGTNADVLSDAFFTAPVLSSLASRLSWTAGPGNYSRITWDGTTLYTTGNAINGPDSAWPCLGSHPACLSGTSMSTTTADGIFCLANACGGPFTPENGPYNPFNHQRRARINDMFARAVIAARLVSGASLAGLRVPFYPRIMTDHNVSADAEWDAGAAMLDEMGIPTGLELQRATVGFIVTRSSDGAFNIVDQPFDRIDVSAYRIVDDTGSALVDGQEWTLCPYDASGPCVELFDDVDDVDDTSTLGHSDRDLPMFVRELPELRGLDAGSFARDLWSRASPGSTDTARRTHYVGLGREVLRDARAADTRVVFDATRGFFDPGVSASYPLLDATMYWRRTACGAVRGGNCDSFGRDGGEEAAVVAESRTCWAGGGTCSYTGCTTQYHFACWNEANSHSIDFHSTVDGNRAFIAAAGLTERDVVNGLELLCDAASSTELGDPTLIGCTDPPEINTVLDATRAESFLRCRSANLRALAANSIIRDLPARVVDVLRADGGGSVVGTVTGEYGAQVSELRAAMLQLRDAEDRMALTADQLANELAQLRIAIGRSSLAHRIEDLSLASTIADRITTCAVSALNGAAEAVGQFGTTTGLRLGAVAATCINSGIQVGLTTAISGLRHEGLELDVESAFIGFDSRYGEATADLSAQITDIRTAIERIDAALARIRSLQDAGRTAVARALHLDSDSSGRRMVVDTVMRRRYSTVLARYREAHQRAIRLSYIARIALEQRLGMSLLDMTDDLVTVEAPARWAANLCGLPSIDYDRIRTASPGPTGERGMDDEDFVGPDGYSGLFVGDYVRRLEQVFESYNFAYPFQDGTDTVVLSLRDDVHRIRAACETEAPNLLSFSGRFDMRATEERPGWSVDRCADLDFWPTSLATPPLGSPPEYEVPDRPRCMGAFELETDTIGVPASPLPGAEADFGAARGYRIEFGGPSVALLGGVYDEPEVSPDPIVTAGTYAGATTGTRLVQWLSVPAGRYRVSWYGRAIAGQLVDPRNLVTAIGLRTQSVGGVLSYEETPLPLEALTPAAATPTPGAWVRFHGFVDVPSGLDLGIALVPGWGVGADLTIARSVEVAAVMVENVDGTIRNVLMEGAAATPGPYFETGEAPTRVLPVCEDTSGENFRREAWDWGCSRLCPDGVDGDCPEGAAEFRCYWQTSFSVASDVIERLANGSSAGFAAGNYNYRIESIGVNLVGTNLRDCGRTGGFSGCYASGNFAYSVLHDGPFTVRNARGALYNAPLFRGRIEGARALAAERYLTNPLSSSDRGLIDPFTRIEMRGRPLGGALTIRVWDDPELVWENVEDVQVVLGYRYWTPQR